METEGPLTFRWPGESDEKEIRTVVGQTGERATGQGGVFLIPSLHDNCRLTFYPIIGEASINLSQFRK